MIPCCCCWRQRCVSSSSFRAPFFFKNLVLKPPPQDLLIGRPVPSTHPLLSLMQEGLRLSEGLKVNGAVGWPGPLKIQRKNKRKKKSSSSPFFSECKCRENLFLNPSSCLLSVHHDTNWFSVDVVKAKNSSSLPSPSCLDPAVAFPQQDSQTKAANSRFPLN